MNSPDILYHAIELQQFKPLEIWDKLPYHTKYVYCERSIASGSWKNMPALVVEYVETKTATKSASESRILIEQ